MPIQIIGTNRLYRQIAEQLSALIASGEFAEGARLPSERELAAQLGVSRPSVREALIALELAGKVAVRVGAGVFVAARRPTVVADPTSEGHGPFELLRARRLVEGEIAMEAALHAIPEDLVVVQWDCAFILDTQENALVLLDLFEFANSQLVEFRTYDAQLDAQIDTIYGLDQTRRSRLRPLHRREAEQRADQLGYLLVDIRELSDRASNALKIIGDAYYARVYRALAARLGIDVWQREIESKLDSVGDLYRYLIDQAQAARSEFLEVIVIVLIAVEIVVGVLGLLLMGRH